MNYPGCLPALHLAFLDGAMPALAADPRVLGVAAAGSFADDSMDKFSDLDPVLACNASDHAGLMRDRFETARSLGGLAAVFTDEHSGESRLLIGLYGARALHVDIKPVTSAEPAERVDEPAVRWEREAGALTAVLARGEAA